MDSSVSVLALDTSLGLDKKLLGIGKADSGTMEAGEVMAFVGSDTVVDSDTEVDLDKVSTWGEALDTVALDTRGDEGMAGAVLGSVDSDSRTGVTPDTKVLGGIVQGALGTPDRVEGSDTSNLAVSDFGHGGYRLRSRS